MTKETIESLGLFGLRPAPIVFQLANRSTIKIEGVVEEITVSIDSWEYLIDFIILQTKAKLGGYPLILGIPWLVTVDAYINCRLGNITISYGNSMKNITLYPPTKPLLEFENPLWFEDSNEELTNPLLTPKQVAIFKEDTKYEFICTTLIDPHDDHLFPYDQILGKHFQKTCSLVELVQQLNTISS